MNTVELSVTTIAVLLSPLIALQVQTRLERAREKRERRASVFHILMATRAARLSTAHVEALNRIDIEFYGKMVFGHHHISKQEREVQDSWRLYLDHLNTRFDPKDSGVWGAKGEELFTELLYQISKAVGYDFDKVYLKRSAYFPTAHANQELDTQLLRSQLMNVLSGTQPLSIAVTLPNSTTGAESVLDTFFEHLLTIGAKE